MEKTLEKNIVKGGGFLFNHPHFSEIFIPEEFDDEQKMMAKATQDFIDKEVFPLICRKNRCLRGRTYAFNHDQSGRIGSFRSMYS